MADPITRVLTALELLQARDRVTGAELAERLEVDLRTVQRYVRKLRELNIPVEASPGMGGAYRLRPGFRLPPLLLTNEEAFALTLGLRALRQIGLEAFAPATEGASAKLSRVLPFALRASVEQVDEVVALERNAWIVGTPAEHLMTAAGAIREGRRMGFVYQARSGERLGERSRRRVEPYAVLHTDDRWYLVGFCVDRGAVRTFRLDRVTEMEVLDQTFVRPEGFDAQRYLAERLPFVQSDYAVDVWIDLPVEAARQSFAMWRVVMEEEGAGTRLRCGRNDLDFFAGMLLAVRRRLVVHGPAELRETLRAMAGVAAGAGEEAGGEGCLVWSTYFVGS